jgi:Arc/MetJ family transcription regulator
MSLAAETREAVRRRPVLYDGLRAGIVNYTAAAKSLDIDGDTEAIATALRRFGDSLSAEEADADGDASEKADRSLTVRMESGIDRVDADALLAVDGAGFGGDGDTEPTSNVADESPSLTAIHATGDVDSELLATVVDRLRIDEIEVHAAGVADDALVVLVPRRSGATALRLVEAAA